MRRFWSLSLAGLICLASSAAALGAGWDLVGQYSIASNPTGAWSYGRKWSATAPGLDVFGVRWGSYGWYMGNVGHGGPSIQGVAGSSVILWAKNNSNGLACARWTAPFAGRFTLHAAFVGADSRGVDNNVYVVVDGVQLFEIGKRGPRTTAARARMTSERSNYADTLSGALAEAREHLARAFGGQSQRLNFGGCWGHLVKFHCGLAYSCANRQRKHCS